MVHRCCISSCKMNVRVAEAKGLSYHCFPLKDPHREKWIQAILPHVDKPENFKIVQGYTRVCSRHFRIKEYSLDSKKRARLNSNAVPSVFPRKNTPVFVQTPIEGAKSQVALIQSAAKAASNGGNNSTISSTDDAAEVNGKGVRVKEEPNLNQKFTESISSNDQKILDLLKTVSVDSLDELGLGGCAPVEDPPSDGSNEDKQDQTKRKRRKWNRTAFARSKTKQKKHSNDLTSSLTDTTTFDDDALEDLNLCSLLGLTRNNSLDLEPDLEIHSGVESLGLNRIENNGMQPSTSSSSSISLCDPIKLEDLNLMSFEEQELLQSIQAVSLDCGEADMNLNLKNIHLGPEDLVTAESDLLSGSTRKSLLGNPILLEDALISSASEMSLQSSAEKKKARSREALKSSASAPSASEIEKLACDFRSSLLTSVNLPGTIDLALDHEDLRLPGAEFSTQNSIALALGDRLTVSESGMMGKRVGEEASEKHNQTPASRQLSKTASKKGPVPKKKLVGITKKPKNSDKYFGKFSVERFSDSDKDIEYYTGFPTFSHFEAFFNSLENHVEKLKVTDIMHGVADLIRTQQLEAQPSSKEEGPEDHKRRPIAGRSMSRIDELFMTLIRLKRRLPEKVLGHMFYVSQPTVSRTIRAWTMLLSKLLEPIPSSPESGVGAAVIATESQKSRQSRSKSNGESNYFTNKGIYIPDTFRQLFLSDVATSIISSAHNPRVNSVSTSIVAPTSNDVVETLNNNNEESNDADCPSSQKKSRSAICSKEPSCKCEYECSCPSAPSLEDNDERIIAFVDSNNIMGHVSEVEIDSNDYFQWGLLVKE